MSNLKTAWDFKLARVNWAEYVEDITKFKFFHKIPNWNALLLDCTLAMNPEGKKKNGISVCSAAKYAELSNKKDVGVHWAGNRD